MSIKKTSEKIKLVYIMGTGRSGSTVLEILLGHGEDCIGVGELSKIVEDGIIDNKICSCGTVFDKCMLWSEVLLVLGINDIDIVRWAKLQKKIDWHDGFLRKIFNPLYAKDLNDYLSYNENLLNAIKKVSRKNIVIDSSKYAARALALSECNNIDLSIIWLTRSPKGLIDSFGKINKNEQPPKKPWAVVLYYFYVSISSLIVQKKNKKKVIRVRYEKLLKDPELELFRIGEKCEINLSSVVQKIKNNQIFDTEHLITGNRLRKNKYIKFDSKISNSSFKSSKYKMSIFLMNILDKLLDNGR